MNTRKYSLENIHSLEIKSLLESRHTICQYYYPIIVAVADFEM